MKKTGAICTLISILLFVPTALAIPLEIEITPRTVETIQYDSVSYTLKIENQQLMEDSFLISVDGPHLEWKMPGSLLLKIGPESTETTRLTFYPTEEGSYIYTVSVTSHSKPEISASQDVHLEVKPRAVVLQDFQVDKSEENLELSLTLVSSEKKQVPVYFLVRKDGEVVQTLSTTQTVDGRETVSKFVPLSIFKAGDYVMEASVGDSSLNRGFSIEPRHALVEKTEMESGFLYDLVTISVENKGNIIEENYHVEREVGGGGLTGGVTAFATKPENCQSSEGKQKCEFVIDEIQPGSTARVVYRIDYWPTYAQYIAIVVALGVLGFMFYGEVTRPRIKKKHFDKNENEHHIILEVKNPSKKIKNVLVRDFVSPLADVIQKFEHIKPVVKKSEAGTELIWKVGQMKPGEERVLNYRIKPLVEGELKMPKAYLRFRKNNGERVKIYSDKLVIEAN